MRIVKKGRVPVFTHQGTCELCGCHVYCENAEVSAADTVPCPTPECGQKIRVKRGSTFNHGFTPEPAKSAELPPAPGHESGFYDGYR